MTGVQLHAGVDFSLGDIQSIADGMVDSLRPQADPRPIYFTRAATAWSDGVNPSILDLGSPPTGSLWQLRFVTTFGSDAFTTIASGANPPVLMSGAMFAGDPQGALNLAQLLLVGLQWPVTRYIPDTTTWCHPNQSLFIVTGVYVPPLGQQVGAVVGIEEWRERDVSRNSGA